jgi:hypothetical protein
MRGTVVVVLVVVVVVVLVVVVGLPVHCAYSVKFDVRPWL